MILTGNKEYYKGIDAIKYEGKDSDNPLAFKYYDPTRYWLYVLERLGVTC